MTVTNVFNHGVIIWDDGGELDVPEQPLLIHVDSGGIIVIDQAGQSVVLQARTVETLCKILRETARVAKKK